MPDGAEGNVWLSSARLPALVVGLATAVYALTAAPHILGPDNPELATLLHVGGVAHPSGYPLFVLYLRAMRFLPGTPAHASALANALMAGLALYLAYRAMRARGASVATSTILLGAHAFSSRAWILATHAEVFAMNAAIAAAIVWIAIDPNIKGEKRVALLCLLAGLGIANHHSIVLLAPIGIYGVVIGIRESGARAAALGALAFLFGLLPYAYVLAIGRSPGGHFVWGDVSTPSGLFFHFRRGEYGTASFAVHSQRADRLGQIGLLASNTARGLVGLPLIALLGVRRKWSAQTVCLALSVCLAGPAFVSLFNLSTEGLDRIVVERFHLLPQLLLCVLIAPAIDRLLTRVRGPIWPVVPLTALSALLAFPDVREHNRPSVELYVRNTLAFAPENAIVVGSGDHRFGGFLYAREALELRRDFVYLDGWLLLNPWYRRRMSAILGVSLVEPVDRSLSTVALAEQLLATGRPVFIANPVSSAIGMTFPTYPLGTLRRVLPKGSALPPPDVLEAMNHAALAKMTLEPTVPSIGTWGGDLQRSYAEPWRALAKVWEEQGRLDRADACRQKAAQLEPHAD